jgi:hypothetical protein
LRSASRRKRRPCCFGPSMIAPAPMPFDGNQSCHLRAAGSGGPDAPKQPVDKLRMSAKVCFVVPTPKGSRRPTAVTRRLQRTLESRAEIHLTTDDRLEMVASCCPAKSAIDLARQFGLNGGFVEFEERSLPAYCGRLPVGYDTRKQLSNRYKQKTPPKRGLCGCFHYAFLRRLNPSPASPRLRRAREVGSGTLRAVVLVRSEEPPMSLIPIKT